MEDSRWAFEDVLACDATGTTLTIVVGVAVVLETTSGVGEKR